jgi:nickel/cobalt transporter (NicO) family protein
MKLVFWLLFAGAGAMFAHPMGNFSVSHYAAFEVSGRGVDLTYALDLAELPTFDLLRAWKLERNSPQAQLEAKASEQAKVWVQQLKITSDGKTVRPKIQGVKLLIADGAGNLPILRITTRMHIDGAADALAYEDLNFPDRAGWKEIVIRSGSEAKLLQASQKDHDVSKALTEYPPDPTIAPPQDLRAEMKWSVERPLVAERKSQAPVVIVPIPQPARVPPSPAPAASTTAAPPGTVVRGDALSRLLHQREITPWMMLVGIAMAFALGAAHALTPGHGKTIVAAYLVGSRGTLKHAAFLGAMVTFTHTISVFALGLATLFLYRYVMPEKIVEVLGVISGLSIVAIGLWMFYKRWGAMRAHGNEHHHEHPHDHTHHHDHPHDHPHTHDHGHEHTHDHDHEHAGHHHHHHGPDGHKHMPDEISWGGLVALGVSGGLVPCESALILLLGAVALGRVGLGLLLLVFFSLGLAIVLMAIGAMVLYARNLIPERKRSSDNFLFRWLPLASATTVVIIGIIMTEMSIRWTQAPPG